MAKTCGQLDYRFYSRRSEKEEKFVDVYFWQNWLRNQGPAKRLDRTLMKCSIQTARHDTTRCGTTSEFCIIFRVWMRVYNTLICETVKIENAQYYDVYTSTRLQKYNGRKFLCTVGSYVRGLARGLARAVCGRTRVTGRFKAARTTDACEFATRTNTHERSRPSEYYAPTACDFNRADNSDVRKQSVGISYTFVRRKNGLET